jgi:hypothetical protein
MEDLSMVQGQGQSIWMRFTVLGLKMLLLVVHFNTLEMSVPTADHILKMLRLFAHQCVQKVRLNADMVILMTRSLLVYLLSNVVMVLMTVLEEKMNWITTVPVDQREQFV